MNTKLNSFSFPLTLTFVLDDVPLSRVGPVFPPVASIATSLGFNGGKGLDDNDPVERNIHT